MDADSLRIGRDRLLRVFRFLEALNQHRNPAARQISEQLWTLWMDKLPDHPAVQQGRPRVEDKAKEPIIEKDIDDESFILRVSRPKLTHAPDPGLELKAWLESGWEDPFKNPSVRSSKNENGPDGKTILVKFEDDRNRVSSWNQWRAKHEEWSRNERPARMAMKVFEDFYQLYGRIEREGERVELVLGDGLLSWRRAEGGVFHPVLLQRLQLTFDPAIPRFTISETERPPELYSALFQSMADVDGRAIGRCMEELEQGNYQPMGDEATSGFLKKLVIQLSSRGEFVEAEALEGEKGDPRIARRPAFFLRPRTLGFAACIEGILEDIRDRKELSWPLLNVVGIEAPKETVVETAEPGGSTASEISDVLLSKEANPEQIRIAQQTDSSAGTLVQGPPGTGKTHTIGNLIGHLLASGKSVLVTSHTTKALRMVRSQVVGKLRSLCVSVLENDLESRKQMESAVGTIAERLSRVDARSLAAEGARLSHFRNELLAKLSEFRTRLVEARADEYRDVLIGGKTWAPSDAARLVKKEQATHGWIPEPVALGVGLPLPHREILELYATNETIKPDVEQELSNDLPDPGHLPTLSEFEELVSTREKLSSTVRNLREELWAIGSSKATPESLSAIANKLEKVVEPLSGEDRWKLAAVHAGRSGGPHREPWDSLVSQIERADIEIAKSQEILLKHSTELENEMDVEEQERTALEVHAHLREGNTLNFFTYLTHSAWKNLVQSARVNGNAPATAEHFLAISKHSRTRILRRELSGRWDRQMAPLGAAPADKLGKEIEKSAVQFCNPIRDCLSWSSGSWAPLESELKESGFLWEKFMVEQPPGVGTDGALQRLRQAVLNSLLPILASRIQRLLWDRNETLIAGLRDKLAIAKAGAPRSRVASELYDAVRRPDRERYREQYSRLIEIHAHSKELQRRRELLSSLELAAPAWAMAIRMRSGVHGQGTPPGDPTEAWIWRQLHDELEKRASVSLEELQSSIEKCTGQIRLTTIDLIDNRAWAFQADRTSLSQRQALIGWLDTIRKIGKGTGMRVPRLRAEAAQQMTDCRGAVPVWIMPLSRVVENFDPRKSRFDVVIIDEASQSDVMALVAFYLGKKVVVVGDHEQVSPSAVGQEVAVVQNLIDQFLQGIPNAHLYDGQTSVYDLARQSFGGTIRLVEHFRCVTEVIQFSNDLSYFGDIKPLRDSSRVVLRPHTICLRVAGATREDKVNRQEAEVVASLITAAVEQPEYQFNEARKRTSFGAVSLVGEDQALEIDRLLHLHIPPEIYDRHRILCGTPAQFQGDERDVMFLSMVDTPAGGPLYFRDQQMFKQRYNVAASRARDQMWVVHSLNAQTDLRTGDLRRRLIEHAQDPTALLRVLEDKERRTESPFEREVLRRLVRAGYRVTPQWKVGARRIDLVVEGDGQRLAVECDGDRFHAHEKLAEDMERLAVLERLGWIFARIRGSVYFRDPERAMKSVFEKLQALEILPSQESMESTAPAAVSNELTDRVCRRAEQLRQEWDARNGNGNPA
ncbi:MAG TPA: AAA domain-containing protein [Candidatus Acidoferrum sp.]